MHENSLYEAHLQMVHQRPVVTIPCLVCASSRQARGDTVTPGVCYLFQTNCQSSRTLAPRIHHDPSLSLSHDYALNLTANTPRVHNLPKSHGYDYKSEHEMFQTTGTTPPTGNRATRSSMRTLIWQDWLQQCPAQAHQWEPRSTLGYQSWSSRTPRHH